MQMKTPSPGMAEKSKPTKQFRSRFGIIAVAEDEAQQQNLYERMKQALPNTPLKVVCV